MTEQNQIPDSYEEEPVKPFFSGRKKLIIMGLTVIIVIGLGLGLYLYFFSGGKISTLPEETNNTSPANTNTSSSPLLNQTVIIDEEEGDYDRDGLSNNKETSLKTDPKNPDTDSDGLTDYEEVMIYKTDPLNPDTDGDGYLDGAEVKEGYNPLGSGYLLDTQKAIEENQ